MSKFHWCFIGTGVLGSRMAEAFLSSNLHELISVYTSNYEKGELFCEKYGGKAFQTPEEAILCPGVDAVYVVTPHNSHFFYSKLALELGKPVLCEKPFTMNAKEAELLFSLAKKKNLYLVEGMFTWFSPISNQVKQLLDSDSIGNILSVSTSYIVDVRNYAKRILDPNLGGGALLDSGVYPLTYLYRLFGKPKSLVATSTLENGIDLQDEISFVSQNGLTMPIHLDIANENRNEQIQIIGSTGTVTIPYFHGTSSFTLEKEGVVTDYSVSRDDVNVLSEFNHVREEILSGKTESTFVPPQATLDVMHMLDDIRKQIGLVYPFE